MAELQVIMGVPGPWPDRAALTQAVASRSDWLFAGSVLRHQQTGAAFEVEIYDRDPGLRSAFEIAGEGRFDASDLDQIQRHGHTVYLVGAAGSVPRIWEAARAV